MYCEIREPQSFYDSERYFDNSCPDLAVRCQHMGIATDTLQYTILLRTGGRGLISQFSVCTCSAPLSCAVCFVFVYRYINYIYSAPSHTQAFESFLNNVIWSLNFEQLKYFSSHSYV